MPAALVYIVRHGETDENRAGVMQGQLDTSLNAAGEEQARRTASALERVPFVCVHSSDLCRAVKTAETILAKQSPGAVLEIKKHVALRERYMGDMQGEPVAKWGGALPENMEPAAEFVGRADKWWKEHIVRFVGGGGGRVVGRGGGRAEADAATAAEPAHILVVSHGGLIRVLVQSLLGSRRVVCGPGVEVDARLRCANASVTVIELERSGKGTLALFADTTHLDVDLVEGNADVVEDGTADGEQASDASEQQAEARPASHI